MAKPRPRLTGWRTPSSKERRPMEEQDAAHPELPAHVLRREGSHLYGLVITGAVLASVDQDFRLSRVALVLLSTLAIYWVAETFVHWTTAQTLLKRDLTRTERRSVVADGWPLVAA